MYLCISLMYLVNERFLIIIVLTFYHSNDRFSTSKGRIYEVKKKGGGCAGGLYSGKGGKKMKEREVEGKKEEKL